LSSGLIEPFLPDFAAFGLIVSKLVDPGVMTQSLKNLIAIENANDFTLYLSKIFQKSSYIVRLVFTKR
jgi:hypothetical protein